MTKHFKATHKETGDTIEFGLGDIEELKSTNQSESLTCEDESQQKEVRDD